MVPRRLDEEEENEDSEDEDPQGLEQVHAIGEEEQEEPFRMKSLTIS